VVITHDGQYYKANILLLSKLGAQEFQNEGNKISVGIMSKDSYSKKVVEDIIEGSVKVGMSQIKQKKNKWYLYVAYTSERYIPAAFGTGVMNVKWGVRTPFSAVIDGTDIRLLSKVEADEVSLFFKRSLTRQSKIQSLAKYGGSGSEGHGCKRKLREVRSWGDRVSRFKESMNHKYSKRIVDYAVKYKCSDILLPAVPSEEENVFLKPWAWYQMYNMIQVKAEMAGITVSKLSDDEK
jgi:transposase